VECAETHSTPYRFSSILAYLNDIGFAAPFHTIPRALRAFCRFFILIGGWWPSLGDIQGVMQMRQPAFKPGNNFITGENLPASAPELFEVGFSGIFQQIGNRAALATVISALQGFPANSAGGRISGLTFSRLHVRVKDFVGGHI